MAFWDGKLDLVRKIKSNDRLSKTKFIFSTAEELDYHKLRGPFEAGVDEFVTVSPRPGHNMVYQAPVVLDWKTRLPIKMLKPRMLLVDDDPIVRDNLASIYNSIRALEIDTASDGLEAASKIESAHSGGRPYSIIVSDWNMPNRNGLQLLEWVRTHASVSDTPFVLNSSDDLEGADAQKAHELHLNLFLKKPYSSIDAQKALSLAKDPFKITPPLEGKKKILVLGAVDTVLSSSNLDRDVTVADNISNAQSLIETASREKRPYDLVIAEWGGFSSPALRLLQWMKSNPAYKDIKFNVASPNPILDEDLFRLLHLGVDEFHQVPVKASEMRNAIAPGASCAQRAADLARHSTKQPQE